MFLTYRELVITALDDNRRIMSMKPIMSQKWGPFFQYCSLLVCQKSYQQKIYVIIFYRDLNSFSDNYNNIIINLVCNVLKIFLTTKNPIIYQSIVQVDKAVHEKIANLFVAYNSWGVYDAFKLY